MINERLKAAACITLATIFVFGLLAIVINRQIQLRKPLSDVEIDTFGAIRAGEMDECNYAYDMTREGEWWENRALFAWRSNEKSKKELDAAEEKYKKLTLEQRCALLEKFSKLLQRWRG